MDTEQGVAWARCSIGAVVQRRRERGVARRTGIQARKQTVPAPGGRVVACLAG